MRVVHFAGTMRLGQDGVTRVLYRYSEAMKRRGIEHLFVSPVIPEDGDCDSPIVQVNSVHFPLYPDYRLALSPGKTITETLNYFQPDILHIHSPCTLGYAAIRYAKLRGIPTIATYHTHFPIYAKYYNLSFLENIGWSYLRKLYNSCDTVLIPSTCILQELRARGFQTCRYLPHGVDTSLFRPAFRSYQWRNQLGASQNDVILLFVGRLVWEKGLDILAGVFERINREIPQARLVIAGDGPAKRELRKRIPKAVFLGHVSGVDLSTTYASSDIFVFPSVTETFGNVTLEAMSSGLVPVCAAGSAATDMVISSVTGELCLQNDIHDFTQKIIGLIEAPERRRRLAYQAYKFSRNHSWDRVCDQLFELYKEICERNSSLYKTREAA